MKILEAFEEGPVPVEQSDVTIDGDIWMRADVFASGYVEWRTDKSSTRNYRRDTSMVKVKRQLFARGFVGLLPLTPDLGVLVRPKFPASISAMVESCQWTTTPITVLREYMSTGTASDWMVTRLVLEFLDAVTTLLDRGLMRNYVRRTITSASPKGRVLVRATLQTLGSRGIDYKAVSEHFERTDQNPPNQAIVGALNWSRLWSQKHNDPAVMRRATQALAAFEGVAPDPERAFLLDPHVRGLRQLPESRQAYRRALDLAVALLERKGFSLDAADGTLGLTSLLVETDKLFEEYVRSKLRECLADDDLSVLDGNELSPKEALFQKVINEALVEESGRKPSLLRGRGNKINPDILVRDSVGQTRLVIDVKYKALKDQGQDEETAHADRAAIEQCVTYGARLGCDRVMSIHPTLAGQSSGLFISGRIGHITVYQYRLDLGAEILEDEVAEMARSVDDVIRWPTPPLDEGAQESSS